MEALKKSLQGTNSAAHKKHLWSPAANLKPNQQYEQNDLRWRRKRWWKQVLTLCVCFADRK